MRGVIMDEPMIGIYRYWYAFREDVAQTF